MRKNVEKVMSEAAVKKLVANEELSKSKKMVALFEGGYEIKDIANIMNVRYNFAYNVVSNYVNVNGIKVETSEKEGKNKKIEAMLREGATPKEVSIELKTPINYVYAVQKKVKNEKEAAAE